MEGLAYIFVKMLAIPPEFKGLNVETAQKKNEIEYQKHLKRLEKEEITMVYEDQVLKELNVGEVYTSEQIGEFIAFNNVGECI